MIKVCGDEDQDDVEVKREIEELRRLNEPDSQRHSEISSERSNPVPSNGTARGAANQQPTTTTTVASDPSHINLYDIPLYVEPSSTPAPSKVKINIHRQPAQPSSRLARDSASTSTSKPSPKAKNDSTSSPPPPHQLQSPSCSSPSITTTKDLICPICSLTNPALSPLCTACSHVLDTRKVTHFWRCDGETCRGSGYVNAGDCGRCGVCGGRRDGDGGD